VSLRRHSDESGPPQSCRAALIGGGEDCKRLLQLLETVELKTGLTPIIVLAVADDTPEGPGALFARAKGIRVVDGLPALFQIDGLEVLIDLGDDPQLRRELRRAAPDQVSIMDREAAEGMLGLLRAQEIHMQGIRRRVHSARMEAVAEMSTYFAHEIRNPLMSIGGFAQSLISSDCLKNESCLHRARIIVDEARRLEDVLRNIWDLTRPLGQDYKKSDLNEAVRQTVEMLRPDMESAGVSVDLELGPDVGRSFFDPGLIKQACLNVIKNAAESMPGGGRISVRTGRGWNFLSVLVRDQGPGIPEEMADQIFNPFFTTKEGALGLGLAMARKIVEDHGGSVMVRPGDGIGTEVEFHLPAQAPPQRNGEGGGG